jgi:hypothetical protein
MIINQFQSEFNDLELLVKKIPNLRNLTICTNGYQDTFGAGRWECLIRSSLPKLNTFNFAFKFDLDSHSLISDMHNPIMKRLLLME